MKCLGVCARCVFRAMSYSVSGRVFLGEVFAFLFMMMSVFTFIGLACTDNKSCRCLICVIIIVVADESKYD